MSHTTIALLDDFPLVLSLPVQWGDQDAFGHVNNTVYFRWYESARIAYSDKIGLTTMKETTNIGPILASIKCDYRLQIKYPDTVSIGASIRRLGRSSITMVHKLFSQQSQAIAAEGESTIVLFDYNTQRSQAIPDELRQVISKFEGRSL